MNKHLITALGVIVMAPAALAQSSVGMYGMLDIGVRRMPNLAVSEKAIHSVDDASRSRIGFRGKEDLGDGMSAFFRLESSLRVDTGTQRDAKFWDDKSWVGLDDPRYGNVALGRLRSPIDEMTSGSRFEAFEGFSLAAALGRFGRADDAWDNSVYYISPSFKGLKIGAGARAGEGATQRSMGWHVEYTAGAFDGGFAYQRDGESATSSKQSWGGGLAYKLPSASVFATYVRSVKLGASDAGSAYTASLGVRVPMGPGELRAALRKVDVDHLTSATSHAGDVDTTHLGMGYQLPLSKRTSINASLVRQTRRSYTASGAVATDRSGIGTELALRVYF